MVETFTSRQKKKKELAVGLVPFKPKRDDMSKGRHMSLYVYFKLLKCVGDKIKCRV